MIKRRRFDDAELIRSIKTDRDINPAIQFLYEEHFDKLSSLITFNNGSAEDAQDIFQEVVVNFIDTVRQDKFRGDSSVKTFLYALTRNTWLNELKKRDRYYQRNKVFEIQKDKEDDSMEASIENREMKRELLEVFSKLGESCQKILTLFYFENLSMKEILQETEYENEQVVRNKKSKCLKHLSELVKNNPNIITLLKQK